MFISRLPWTLPDGSLSAMASARPAPPDRRRGRGGKRGFAKRASGFVKRATALPGFPYLWLAMFAIGVLMIVTGGFNTGRLEPTVRTGFWALLLGWSALKWQIWFALTVRRPQGWMRAALIGCVLLNLLLPVEIGTALGIVGVKTGLDAPDIWLRALLISVGIFPVMWFIGRQFARNAPVEAAPPPPGGLLDRAKVAPDSVLAIEAEDHYCRVRHRKGSDALIHYRFGDALGEVAGLEGVQVHRGAWVANGAVTGATREGRRWLLELADGSKVAVSATHLAAVRAKGWLAK
jgi:hypothetical protein